MNKVLPVLGGITGGFIIGALISGLVASGLALLGNVERAVSTWVIIGLSLDIFKLVVAIWGGYLIFKWLGGRNFS